MDILEKLKNHKYLIFALFFALLNMGAIFLIFGFQEYGDSPEYIGLIHWFQGDETGLNLRRLVTPLGPLLALPFEPLARGAGLIIQNIFFYLLSSFLIFKITELIYKNQRQAMLASIFFVISVQALSNGISYLTDAGGWFFYLLSIFLTLLYFKSKNNKLIPVNGFLAGLGFLMKESGGLGVLFFGSMILLSRNLVVKEKIIKILYFGIFFFVPILIWQAWTFKYFHFTAFHNYLIGRAGTEGEGLILSSFRYIGQLFIVIGILWPFVFIGLWRELKEKNWERMKIFLALIPSSFVFLFWSTWAGARTVFYFAPLGIILATYGLDFFWQKLGEKKGILMISLLILFILVFNYYFVLINTNIAFVDKIAQFLGIL